MAKSKINSIGVPTAIFKQQHEDAVPCLDLMGGTEAMRAAAERYIMQKEAESKRNYFARINRTVLRNVFSQTIGYYCGQVFSRDVALDNISSPIDDKQLQQFKDWAEDVNQRGKNITAWSSDAFASGLISGVTFCLVDYPKIYTEVQDGVTLYRSADGEMRVKNAAADESEGWKPYFVHIPAEQVLDCRAEWENGRQKITHFRYFEIVYEAENETSFDVVGVKYIHAYWPGRWELWRVLNGKDDANLQKVSEGTMALDEIPLAVYMPGTPKSEFTARPALMDLAWLNIWHWQATSEQNDLLAYVRLPVWLVTGAEQKYDKNGNPMPIPFGPGNVIFLGQGGTVQSIGVNPSSVEAGRQDLKDIEDAMTAYGLQNLNNSTGYFSQMTAAQVNQRTRESNSQLKNWALSYKDFLENCLRFVAKWWGLEDGPSVQVNDVYANSASIDYVLQLYDKAIISKETLTDFAVRLGVLPDDFNYQDEVAKLARDTTNTANAGQNFNMSLAARLGLTGSQNIQE